MVAPVTRRTTAALVTSGISCFRVKQLECSVGVGPQTSYAGVDLTACRNRRDRVEAAAQHPGRGGSEELLGADFQRDVNLRPIVKLADRFGAALAVVVLRVHLVIDAGLKRREAVCT